MKSETVTTVVPAPRTAVFEYISDIKKLDTLEVAGVLALGGVVSATGPIRATNGITVTGDQPLLIDDIGGIVTSRFGPEAGVDNASSRRHAGVKTPSGPLRPSPGRRNTSSPRRQSADSRRRGEPTARGASSRSF